MAENDNLTQTSSYVSTLGARNVALFLSCLEPDAADALLASFDPQVAREIALEAGRIDLVSQEELQRVIALFLEATNEDPASLRIAQQFMPSVEFARSHAQDSDNVASQTYGAENSQSSVDCTALVEKLKNERPAIIAALLARFDQTQRLAALSRLSEGTRAEISEFMRRLRRPALSSRQLEIVINRLVTDHE